MDRTIDPIVSTEWLADHLDDDLVIVDIREPHIYRTGHIPGSICVPFSPESDWAVSDDELLLELPADEDLFRVIGDLGLSAGSRVVLVGTVEQVPPPYALSDPVRVATTLIYAGIRNAAVLAGGYPKWEREGRATTSEAPEVESRSYVGAVDRDMWVSTEYVRDHIGKCVIIDARDPGQYFGVTVDPFTGKCGHIPTARNLPMIWVWEADGTYRPMELIEGMANGVIGGDKTQQVIAYCGVGGYAATWWFLLTQIFGYTNVKIYDGAVEAWSKADPLVLYSWTE